MAASLSTLLDDTPVQSSYQVPLSHRDRLHVRRIARDVYGPAVLMIHGAVENGRIFYSHSGKGLAPFLAARGYDVFVPDLRGRGESSPRVSRHTRTGQHEAITEELPALVRFVRELKGGPPAFWVTHSWGGVLVTSFLARFPMYLDAIHAMVYFGSKRRIQIEGIRKRVVIDFLWGWGSRQLARVVGYFPARVVGAGSDSESATFNREMLQWVKASAWVDGGDGFDYRAALRAVSLPPIWYIAGVGDAVLGNPADVFAFMLESGDHPQRYTILSRANGNRRDYGHIDMLTAPECVEDHFPRVAEWFDNLG